MIKRLPEKIFRVCILFFCAIIAIPLFAEQQPEEKSPWFLEAGIKAYHSRGISETNTCYKPFLEAGYSGDFLEIRPGYYRYQHYQITDGLGNYNYINFNRGGAEMILHFGEILDLAGEYCYSRGDDRYKSYEYSGEITLNIFDLSLTGAYERKCEEYEYNTAAMKIVSQSISGEIAYFFSRDFSVDAGLDYDKQTFDNLDYDYGKWTARAGFHVKPFPVLTLIAGAGCGKDSADYVIYTLDGGIIFRPYSVIKISALYAFSYYAVPSSETSASSKGKTGSTTATTGYGKVNPYLDSSKIGESFPAHNFSVGASLML